jgi:hypothetical protein
MKVACTDIVQDQENQARRLLEFCGLNWQEACLRFHENGTSLDSQLGSGSTTFILRFYRAMAALW